MNIPHSRDMNTGVRYHRLWKAIFQHGPTDVDPRNTNPKVTRTADSETQWVKKGQISNGHEPSQVWYQNKQCQKTNPLVPFLICFT